MSVLNGSGAIGFLAADAAATGYSISRSVRFNRSDSPYLTRTPVSSGSRTTFTLSVWAKLGNFVTGADSFIWSSGSAFSANSISFLWKTFDGTQTLIVNAATTQLKTTAVYRDPSAWYHFVLSIDTTQGTESNRTRLYVNGTQVTNLATATYPSQNFNYDINTSSFSAFIGCLDVGSPDRFFEGYLADAHFIDGQALTPSSFGETDSNGVWQPKDYTGTFGTNGFHLPFSNNATSATLGTDTSGNNNTWTVNNISATTGGPTSVAAASGALPVYNTTDTYGTVKGTGTRTDSNSSSIVLAIPMDGANNGTTFTDESATIKGSGSPKSITRNGDAKTSTAQSKYYGSSGFFDGTGDYLNVGSSADYLFGTGNFTIESWFYLTSNSSRQDLCGNYSSATTGWGVSLGSSSSGMYFYYGNTTYATTSANLWDVNRWNHIALVRNSSVLKIYLNGIEVSSASAAVDINTTSNNTFIGAVTDTSGNPQLFINGYLQDFRIYKGIAKYTSNFNPPNSIQYPAVAAGNDSLVDSPTNGSQTDTGVGGEVVGNYATLNPLNSYATGLSNGNLQLAQTSNSWVQGNSTIGVSSGKWYWEVIWTSGTNILNGVTKSPLATSYVGSTSDSWGYAAGSSLYNSGVSSSYGANLSVGDVIGVALNLDAGTLVFYKNGASQGQAASGLSGTFFPAISVYGTTSENINFGQRPFAYTAPSGFKALCTANLPTPTIANGATVMNTLLYTGTGSNLAVTGLNFSPDFIWTKARSAVDNHVAVDQVRGVGNILIPNSTQAESAYSAFISFDSNGFTKAALESVNGRTYVAWCWDAGSSTVTNTQGSITSQVRANASAGFSVVTYTGTGSAATVGHGLGVAPSFLIVKQRNAVRGWSVYHKDIGASYYLQLESTNAKGGPYSGLWNDTAPTSTVFSILNDGGSNANGGTYVGYCFAPVAGYSSFGSYVGNGSTDGVFVYTGFRPRWVMIKASSSTGDWYIIDTSRDTYNLSGKSLQANTSNTEPSIGGSFSTTEDILSNGFKLRDGGSGSNGSGVTYVYAAFAESPFAYSRAR
jgi:hypothetical protein